LSPPSDGVSMDVRRLGILRSREDHGSCQAKYPRSHAHFHRASPQEGISHS
jgi:hypothetical protein